MMAFVAVCVMVFTFCVPAIAETITINSASDPAEAERDTTKYTYYKIMDADIEEVPEVNKDGTIKEEGKAAYYVTTQEKAEALTGTGLFNATQAGDENKWYIELKNKDTSAESIASELDSIKEKFSDVSGSFEQTEVGGIAQGEVPVPGYYLITSTLGNKLAVQTLADITINEKNSYPTPEKEVDEEDKSAQIGDEINYTLKVNVPQTANDTIVLTDTMSEGLTFKSIVSVKAGELGVAYTATPDTADGVTKNGNEFTITFDAETVKSNQGKTIVITYTAILNESKR